MPRETPHAPGDTAKAQRGGKNMSSTVATSMTKRGTGEELARELPLLPLYPALFQLNTRIRLTELEAELGRVATLDDIADPELDHWVEQGFDWIYLLGVWRTGEAGRRVSLTRQEWRQAFSALLPDLDDGDICGSSFAVTAYAAHPAMGGN